MRIKEFDSVTVNTPTHPSREGLVVAIYPDSKYPYAVTFQNGKYAFYKAEELTVMSNGWEWVMGDEPELEHEMHESVTGGRKGVKLAAFDQIPTDSLWFLAEAYGKGVAKYPDHAHGTANWRRGYEWSKSYAAAMRHLTAAMGGEDVDPESGTLHVIACAWHCMALAHWWNDPDNFAHYDDRQAVLEATFHRERMGVRTHG